jgi:tyrosine-protein phosphatase SIW14
VLDNYGIAATTGTHRLTRSAQPDEVGFTSLLRQGVMIVVKLCTSGEYPDADEMERFHPGGVLLRPLPGLFRKGCTDQVIGIASIINTALKHTDVHVHCTHGRDRTGLVCAAYSLIYDKARLQDVNQDRAQYGVDNFVISWVDRDDNVILDEIARRVGSGEIK